MLYWFDRLVPIEMKTKSAVQVHTLSNDCDAEYTPLCTRRDIFIKWATGFDAHWLVEQVLESGEAE